MICTVLCPSAFHLGKSVVRAENSFAGFGGGKRESLVIFRVELADCHCF